MGLNGGSQFQPNPSISFFVNCESVQEINHAWELLSEQGKILMPLDGYPWAETYGWVQDKYGVSWQLSFVKSEINGPKAFPSLLFTGWQSGKAQKAMDFYISLFNDSSVISISAYEEGEGNIPGYIKHAAFELGNNRMVVMDSSADHAFRFNEGISLVIPCETQEEIDFYWLNLTEGGKESQCGWCEDAFGVSWQVVPTVLNSLMADPVKAPKVIEAFMKMKKMDIAALLQAAE